MATANDPEELENIQDEIERITHELSQLASFTRLNYTSFVKILKKHDKKTDFMLKPTFMIRLNSKPLYLENLDSLIYRLSKLYDKIRHKMAGEIEEVHRLIESGNAQTFIRKTSKYWVHSENITNVKCTVLKYLPVLIFPSKRRKIDLAVSSVYLDNDDMSLYRGRLEKLEGAMAIRIRWYGSDEPQEVYIERKIHREDWTGEVSVKTRFLLKAKHVSEYLAGNYGPDEIMNKLQKDPKSRPEDIESIGQLAREIQETILTLKLRPKIRTFYNRTAFQLPADARVRISLDTDLVMIREDGPNRSGTEWKRSDIGTIDFDELGEKEIYRFPHAILEVKLQTQAGQEAPQWVEKLIGGPLVEEVPKFSKYIHGCASLFPSSIKIVPYWLPQMSTDIRKNYPESTDLSQSETDDTVMGSSASIIGKNEELPKNATIIPIDNLRSERTPLLHAHDKHETSSGSGNQKGLRSHNQNNLAAVTHRIHVPVRVEPKVFFANERTFLSWIHFSIFLGGISTALVGLGNSHARISGYLFAFVSILFTLYALYLYHWRAERIRQRDPGPYDDRIGPNVVVIIFLLAMTANIIFTASSGLL